MKKLFQFLIVMWVGDMLLNETTRQMRERKLWNLIDREEKQDE